MAPHGLDLVFMLQALSLSFSRSHLSLTCLWHGPILCGAHFLFSVTTRDFLGYKEQKPHPKLAQASRRIIGTQV